MSPALSVSDLVNAFYADLQVRVSAGWITRQTHEWYRYQLDKLRAQCGELPAAELRGRHLTGITLTHHFVRAVKALYKFGADEEQALVPRNPFTKLRTPACGRRDRILTPAEVVKLYRAATPLFRSFLFLQLHLTCRPGELRKLRWNQIDFDRRTITLGEFKAKNRRKDGLKTRVIPMDQDAARRLARWYAERNPLPSEHVFIGRRGKPWTPNAVRTHMRNARKRAGLDGGHGERVVCYTMRHTSATQAVRDGMPENVLSVIMGHTNPAMTRRYQHLQPDDLVNAVDRARARA